MILSSEHHHHDDALMPHVTRSALCCVRSIMKCSAMCPLELQTSGMRTEDWAQQPEHEKLLVPEACDPEKYEGHGEEWTGADRTFGRSGSHPHLQRCPNYSNGQVSLKTPLLLPSGGGHANRIMGGEIADPGTTEEGRRAFRLALFVSQIHERETKSPGPASEK